MATPLSSERVAKTHRADIGAHHTTQLYARHSAPSIRTKKQDRDSKRGTSVQNNINAAGACLAERDTKTTRDPPSPEATT